MKAMGATHGHRQVGLARARRADADDQVVALDGFQVPPLVDRLGQYDLLAETALPAAVHQGPQSDLRILDDHLQVAVHVSVAEDLTLAYQRYVVFQDALRAADAGLLPLDLQRVIEQAGTNVEAGFQQAHVFVTSPEQGLNAAGDLD
ncbi:MAG: hypothetical protein NTZ98_22595 [Acidobacteria bacterium]|nr:hypothetical protein [Acidobacteriota bacterium]